MSNNNTLMTSVQQTHNPLGISNSNLISHTAHPLKIQANNNSSYSVLHVGGNSGIITSALNMPGSSSNMVPLHMSAEINGVQITGPTTSVPVQLPAGATINVPLQMPTNIQNHSLQLSGSNIPLHSQTTCPNPTLHNSLLQVHVASSNHIAIHSRQENIETSSANNLKPPYYGDTQNHVKCLTASNNNCNASLLPIQINSGQIPTSQVQLHIPNNSVQRNNVRGVPHVVYVHTPTGLKPITSTEVISNASSTGNPPQIIVRRPVTSAGGMQLIASGSNRGSIVPKVPMLAKSSLLAPVNQPIVIQKPKQNAIGIPANPSKPHNYSGALKNSANNITESQSILVTNNPIPSNISVTGNQKMFLTPMNMSKVQNTKYVLPVTMPTTISSKGPIINFQIANGQLQNDAQGNITVMSDPSNIASEVPPLHPLGNILTANKNVMASEVLQKDVKDDKPFALSIPGSRAEQTGEQEYSLSIPETSNEMPEINDDDMYTVSISEDSLSHNIPDKSYTVTIQEKSKGILNNRLEFGERQEMLNSNIPAPAILRRSNSDNAEKKTNYLNAKRRISLCYDHLGKKINKLEVHHPVSIKTPEKQIIAAQITEDGDEEVPSLFCDEQLEKDLDYKPTELEEAYIEPSVHIKERRTSQFPQCEDARDTDNFQKYYVAQEIDTIKSDIASLEIKKEVSIVEMIPDEDPPALFWNDGVGRLPGSDIKFQTNEFGLIDVVQNNSHKPSKRQSEPIVRKKPSSPEDLFCCENCGCHGMAAEFVTPSFCSQTCQTELLRKKEKEVVEMKKKKKVKRTILVQKPRTLSETVPDNKEQKEIPQKYEPPVIVPPETSVKVIDQTLLQNVEDNAVNPKYPWMCGKNGFSWMRYLEHCKAKSAPVKLFKDPFPYNRNGFKVGMKLEAIDPVHPALFTVVTVAEVQGYRMRLHFDGYHENFDFWINADSPDIFPPGWCEKNNRSLRPPQGFTQSSFSWALYLKQAKSLAAPRQLFPHLTSPIIRPNGFRVGMKLEAEDRRNSLICVATVADMMDNRLLIHFDSWDDKYDFWVDPSSPYIHPVAWADENDLSLTPPNFYKDPDTFTWEQYLVESEASAVPARAFKPRLATAFRPGMKLEVVDKRVPFLIRVATVCEVKPHQLRVSFDGWPDQLSYWLEEDSPDIHPVGWCLKTGHPLEPPLTADDLSAVGPCGTPGCRGLGSLLGGAEKTHIDVGACPYARAGADVGVVEPPAGAPAPPAGAPAGGAGAHTPPDRLRAEDKEMHERRVPVPREPKKAVFANKRGRPPKYANRDQIDSHNSEPSKERTLPTRGRPPKHRRVEEVSRKIEQVSDEESNGSSTHVKAKRSRRALVERSVLAPEYEARPGRRAPPGWARLCPDVPQMLRASPALHADPRSWTQTDVQDFIKRVVQCRDIAWCFCKHRIAGESFLMMSQEEMVDILGLKLGPAIKIYSTVLQLRKKVLT